jgi:preprotein translocase subunit SecE
MSIMDTKLNPPKIANDATQPAASKRKNLFGFIQDLKEELKKVSWTTRDELVLSTKVVIGATFSLGIGIYLFDLVIKGTLDFIALVAHYIFG